MQPAFEKEHYPASLRNARSGNVERHPSFHAECRPTSRAGETWSRRISRESGQSSATDISLTAGRVGSKRAWHHWSGPGPSPRGERRRDDPPKGDLRLFIIDPQGVDVLNKQDLGIFSTKPTSWPPQSLHHWSFATVAQHDVFERPGRTRQAHLFFYSLTIVGEVHSKCPPTSSSKLNQFNHF